MRIVYNTTAPAGATLVDARGRRQSPPPRLCRRPGDSQREMGRYDPRTGLRALSRSEVHSDQTPRVAKPVVSVACHLSHAMPQIVLCLLEGGTIGRGRRILSKEAPGSTQRHSQLRHGVCPPFDEEVVSGNDGNLRVGPEVRKHQRKIGCRAPGVFDLLPDCVVFQAAQPKPVITIRMQELPKRLAADLLEFIASAWLAVSPKVDA